MPWLPLSSAAIPVRRVRTNSAGWREQESGVPMPAGTVRLLGIGDSHMFGWRVEENQLRPSDHAPGSTPLPELNTQRTGHGVELRVTPR